MIIYTGRFQPFHNGHIMLVKRLQELYPQETICIAIIKNVPLHYKDDFDYSVDLMMTKERNPFDSETTLRIVTKIIKNYFPENVVATLMPRASSDNWSTITSLFDCTRIWVFTENQSALDEWEKKKIEFYMAQGEKVIILPVDKSIEGIDVRNALLKKNLSELQKLLPIEVLEIIDC